MRSGWGNEVGNEEERGAGHEKVNILDQEVRKRQEQVLQMLLCNVRAL